MENTFKIEPHKLLKTKMDGDVIKNMPTAAFDGHIVVVDNQREAQRVVPYLMRQDILGFDTETKPCFEKGKSNMVALLQVATETECFLFRLCKIGLPDCVVQLLSAADGPVRVGLSWHDDVRSLNRRRSFQCAHFEELQNMAHQLGIEDMSLQKLYANIFGQRISKRQRLTNWERTELTPAQQVYAATDAWACVKMYEEMQRLMQTHDYELEKVPEHVTTSEKENEEKDEKPDTEAR